jgi:hypothetical protein
MNFRDVSSGGKDYLKIKDGESMRVIFRGDPVDFRIHWAQGKSSPCVESSCSHCASGNKSSFRFRINTVIKENGAYVPKIFEQGITTYKDLVALQQSGYNIENHVMTVTRHGTQKDTTYSILPLNNGAISQEIADKLKEIKLLPLTGKTESQDAQEGLPSNEAPFPTDEDCPF